MNYLNTGKSTLLECLIGKRQIGLSGQVTVRNYNRIKIAYIPQQDVFFNVLTVREAMLFASKMQNSTAALSQTSHSVTVNDGVYGVTASTANLADEPTDTSDPNFHDKLITNILTKLGLLSCMDTKISACSGGQQKRLSIGFELVSKPNILILDGMSSF